MHAGLDTGSQQAAWPCWRPLLLAGGAAARPQGPAGSASPGEWVGEPGLAQRPQSDCTEPPRGRGAKAALPGIEKCVCQYILLSIPRGALGKPVDKTKCQMLDVVSFSFSLSDCFNCSVVVLMDLRPWSGSCLSDFQLLFVNNLKRKKKKKLYILETNLCEFFIGTNVVFNTRGFVQFFAFSTRKQCKVISQCEEKKKNCHYDQTHSMFCSSNGIQSTQVVIQP